MPRVPRSSLALAAAIALLLPTVAGAWPHSPATPVRVNNGAWFGYSTYSVSDGAGGVIVAWQDYRGSSADVFVQRFDATGRELWTPNGVTLCSAAGYQGPCAMIADGYGGAIVVWNDYRSNPIGDQYARRVDAYGTPLWTADGVLVNGTSVSKYTPQMASDGGGGCFIAWDDYRNIGTTDMDIYVQRLNYSGTAQYAANGIAVCSMTNFQGNVRICADRYGYATLVWEDTRAGAYRIYGQRIYLDGTAQWTVQGAPICALPSSSFYPAIALTATNDIVVTWSDTRVGGRAEIYGQLLRAYDATPFWTPNGVLLLSAPVTLYVNQLVHDGAGGYVVVATEYDGPYAQALLAHRFNLLAAPSWGGGVVLRSGSGIPTSVTATADGYGGVLVAWQDTRGDVADVYAQRVDAYGYARWRNGGLPVGQATGYQQAPNISVGPSGGAYVSFDDYYNNFPSLMAVDEWGYLGAAPVMNDVADVPNDQGGQVRVSWYASPLDTDPNYRNITEYVVYRSVPSQLAARQAPLAALSETDRTTVAGKRYVRTRFAAQDYFWEEVLSVTPRHLSSYSAVVPTTGDSVGGSNPLTAFMVEAVANYGSSFWFTDADSSYSVDDLAPAPPAPFTGTYAGGDVQLHWDPNGEPDLAGYRLYRGTSPSFVPGPASLVSAQPDTGYSAIAGAPYIYKLTAVDSHGNESPPTTLVPQGTLDVVTQPTAFFLNRPAPNPAVRGGQSLLRFGLERGGRADLGIFDASGRRVRTLIASDLPPGEHRVAWDGRADDGRAAPPGLYFVRLVAEGREARQRVARIE